MFTEGVIGSPTQTTLGPVLASPAPAFLLDPILSGSLCPRPFLVLFSFLSCSFSPCLSLCHLSLLSHSFGPASYTDQNPTVSNLKINDESREPSLLPASQSTGIFSALEPSRYGRSDMPRAHSVQASFNPLYPM